MLAVLSLFFLLFSANTWADEHNLRLEVGPTFLSDAPSHGFSLALYKRTENKKWDFGLGYISPQTFRPQWHKGKNLPEIQVDETLFINGQFIFPLFRRFEIGLGGAVFKSKNEVLGRYTAISASAGWHIKDNISIRFRYFGHPDASPNVAYDLLGIGIELNF